MKPIKSPERSYPFRIKLLGTPLLEWKGQPFLLSRKQVRALVYVLATTLQPVSRDWLIFLFWPDSPEATARRNLSRVLSYPRKALPHPELIQINNESISLNLGLVWSDVAHFMNLAILKSRTKQDEMIALYDGELQ